MVHSLCIHLAACIYPLIIIFFVEVNLVGILSIYSSYNDSDPDVMLQDDDNPDLSCTQYYLLLRLSVPVQLEDKAAPPSMLRLW